MDSEILILKTRSQKVVWQTRKTIANTHRLLAQWRRNAQSQPYDAIRTSNIPSPTL